MREDPIDFPVAWMWHRHYSQYFGDGDPGPNEPAQGVSLGPQTPQPADPPGDLHRLQVYVTDLQNRLNQHIDRSKKKRGEDRL